MKKLLTIILCVACISTSLYGCKNPDISQTTATVNTEDAASTADTSATPKWKEFLAEYEAWVDEYVTFMKKFKENSSDLSLLTQSVELAAKAVEWAQEAETYQKELENVNAEELAEYLKTLGRITEKLASVAN